MALRAGSSSRRCDSTTWRRSTRSNGSASERPWPAHAFEQELRSNRLARYVVARAGEQIVGFAGIWMMVDEAHVTTFSVHPDWRRQSIGRQLLLNLAELAGTIGARRMTLEVRESNVQAQALYRSFGFDIVGRRADYYTDDGEDALVMTTPDLEDPADAGRPRERARAHRRMSGPRILAIESSCDETGVAVVVGGRRIEANQVATQVALHAETGGIVPEVAARQQLRWIVPTLEAALAEGGTDWDDIDAVAVTSGPGLIGSLLVGVNVAKALAVAHDLPLIGVNHIEGHIYANWLFDGDATATPARRARVPAAVPGRQRRPHAARPDDGARPIPTAGPDRRRRGRERRSTRSAGCSGCRTPAVRPSAPQPSTHRRRHDFLVRGRPGRMTSAFRA